MLMREFVARLAVNALISAAVFVLGMPFAWAKADPDSALIKALVVGPVLALTSTPFFFVFHLLAGLAGLVAARLGLPVRLVCSAVAALIAYAFISGSWESTFGDPVIGRSVFVVAAALPWLLELGSWWPKRRKS
jgi:hypothetical protein